MNLTDIMLFGKAIIGDGGGGNSGGGTSGGAGSAAFHFSTAEELTTKYTYDETMSALMGTHILKISDVVYSAEELEGSILMTYPYKEIPLMADMQYVRFASDSSENGVVVQEGALNILALVDTDMILLSVETDSEVEGATFKKGTYFNCGWFLKPSSEGDRMYEHAFLLIGT